MTTVKTNNVEGTQNDLTLKSNESNASSNLVLQSGTSGNVKFKQKDSATTFTLPAEDGTSGSKLITDGNGVLSFEGASGGGGSGPILPTTEKLIKTWDFDNYQLTAPLYGTTGLECVVPTSQAATPDLIEQFIWKFENVNFGVDAQANNVQGDFTTWIAPISSTGGTPILDNTNAQYYTYWSEFNKSVGNWQARGSNYSGKDRTHSVTGGSYACNDYGLYITGSSGYGLIYTSNTSSSYHGPGIDANPFTDRTTNAGLHNRTNLTGYVKIYNTASIPDVHFHYRWNEPNGNNQQKICMIDGIGYNYISSNSNVYPVTTGHAQGYKFHFLPYTYSNRETTGIVSGRIELFVRLKEGAQSPSVT
tara:strand:+ start:1547 stop:2632 length:1086 start_codon:yes stop_codon:yes gene_type:complete